MIEVNKEELSYGLDLLMNTPQLKELDTNKQFKNIFSKLLEDVYLDGSKEIKENFRNKPTEKMIKTIFLNYGILPSYYEKLNPFIKRKFVYYLEILFQQKGSIDNLKIISELFKDFFKDINYYGISVNKLPYKLNGVAIPPGEIDPLNPQNAKHKYALSYFLKPIIISQPDLIKYFPNFKVDLTGKYLMKLEQFRQYNMFPIDTNLLYIDFIDSSYLMHSDHYFINGSIAYTMTKFQASVLNFSNDDFLKMLENIHFNDIQLVLQYFNLRFIRFAQKGRKQLDPHNTETLMDFNYNVTDPLSTSLIFNESELDTIEILLLEYKMLKGRPEKKVKDLSRRWQYLLRSNYNSSDEIKNFTELDKFISIKYPTIKNLFDSFESKPGVYSGIDIKNLLPEEIIEVSKVDYVNLLMNLYISVLNSISDGNEFVDLCINGMFQNILNSSIFIDYFFTPVFKIFVNYFMPGDMDYIVSSDAKVIVKDKFESVFIESKYQLKLYSCFMDSRYLPCNKIYITSKTFAVSKIHNVTDKNSLTLNKKQIDNVPLIESFGIKIKKDFKHNYSMDDNRFLKVSTTRTDTIKHGDNYSYTKKNYNFFNNLNKSIYINDYMWKLERNGAITKQINLSKEVYGHTGNFDIGTLEDYRYLKKEMYNNINNYLFYKNNYN